MKSEIPKKIVRFNIICCITKQYYIERIYIPSEYNSYFDIRKQNLVFQVLSEKKKSRDYREFYREKLFMIRLF